MMELKKSPKAWVRYQRLTLILLPPEIMGNTASGVSPQKLEQRG